jgi:rubredoxin
MEQPKSKWIRRHYIKGDKTFDMYVCSNCGEEFSYDAETGVSMHQYRYCPNCGQHKGDYILTN